MRKVYDVTITALGYLLGLFGIAGAAFFVYVAVQLGPTPKYVAIAALSGAFGIGTLVLSTIHFRMYARGNREQRSSR